MNERLATVKKLLGKHDASDAEIVAWLEKNDEHESLDLAFLAAAILEERGDTEGARRWYESVTRRASQKADKRQRLLLGALDARRRWRVTVWALVGIAALAIGSIAAVYGAFVLWLVSMSHAEAELTDPRELAIVRWLSETQTAELSLAANELGDPGAGACGGGGPGGGGCGPRGTIRDPEAMLRALLEGFGGPDGERRGSGGQRREGSGGHAEGTNGLFDRPGGGGPPPRPLPPPPPTPPDPPEDVTLGTAPDDATGPIRTCSAIERACDPAMLPPARVEVPPNVETAFVASIAGLRDEGDCEGLEAVITSGRSIDRRLFALAERNLAACHLDRAEHGEDRTALEQAQIHAERSACADPDEAWRAYLMMVTGAIARESLVEAAAYLGCARRSVRDYQTVSRHPLDTAEAFLGLAAWEWGVMGNEAGFEDAEEHASQILASLDQSAEIDRDDAVRLKLMLDAQWLESHAGTPEFAADLEHVLESPALEPQLHLVVSALEVIHHLLIGERVAAAERLSALIDVYEASAEAHPSWRWSGLERVVMEDPARAGVARQVLVLTRVFTGPRTDAKVLELRGLLASIGGAP